MQGIFCQSAGTWCQSLGKTFPLPSLLRLLAQQPHGARVLRVGVVIPSEVAVGMNPLEAGRVDQVVPLIAGEELVGVFAADLGDDAREEEVKEQAWAVFEANSYCLAHRVLVLFRWWQLGMGPHHGLHVDDVEGAEQNMSVWQKNALQIRQPVPCLILVHEVGRVQANHAVHRFCGHVLERFEHAGNEGSRRNAGVVATGSRQHGWREIDSCVVAVPARSTKSLDEQAGAAGLFMDRLGVDLSDPRHGLGHHPLVRAVAFLGHVVEERVDDPQ